MDETVSVFRSMLTRGLFVVHGFLAIHLGAIYFPNALAWMVAVAMLMLLLLFIESLFIIMGPNKQWKYFFPSGFLYIVAIIFVSWIFDMESIGWIKSPSSATLKCMNMTKENAKRLVLELGLVYGIILGRWGIPRGRISRHQLSVILLNYIGAAVDILELKVDKEIKESGRVSIKIAILGAYTLAIFQFTLKTTVTPSDESQEEAKSARKISVASRSSSKIVPEESLTDMTSIYQKHLNRTSTTADGQSPSTSSSEELKEQYIESIKKQYSRTLRSSTLRSDDKRRKQPIIGNRPGNLDERLPTYRRARSIDTERDSKSKHPRKLREELFQILVTLFMQDGPFLVLRLVMLVEFNVSTEMHIVFMVKNAMVCVLLIYRLCVLFCKAGTDEELSKEEAASKLHNIQLAVVGSSIMQVDVVHANKHLDLIRS